MAQSKKKSAGWCEHKIKKNTSPLRNYMNSFEPNEMSESEWHSF